MPDAGDFLSPSEGGSRLRLSEAEFVAKATVATWGLPVGFFLGMAERESGLAWNEEDTDYDENGEARDTRTYGLLQLSRKEMAAALDLGAIDPSFAIEPEANLRAGAATMARLSDALKLKASNSDYSDEDLMRYICWAHNAGLGGDQAGTSAEKYGIDWQACLARNSPGSYAGPGGRLEKYSDAVIERARQYPFVGGGSDSSLFRLAVIAGALYLGYKLIID